MQQVGVGVIGCGFVGSGAHVPAIQSSERARLVAVADPDAERLRRIAAKYSPDSTYRDYRELIADPRVDAVIVSAPTPLHAEVSLTAMRSGKHVLCEMPLAADLEAVDQMADVAQQQGVVLMPGLTFRFTPSFLKAKEQLASGEVGTPVSFHYRELIPAKDLAQQWPPGSWVWNLRQSGGPLYTLAVWSIDLIHWMFDSEVSDVSAATRYTRLESWGGTLGYDAAATLRLANGMVGCLQYSGTVPASASACELEIVSDTNQLLRTRDHHTLVLLGESPPETTWDVRETGARMWGHLQQDEHFLECVGAGRNPEITLGDGRRAMEIAAEIAAASVPQSS